MQPVACFLRSEEGRSRRPGTDRPRRGSCTGRLWPLSLLLVLLGSSPARAVVVDGVRHSTSPERTRVVLDLTARATFTHRALSNPPRVVVELPASSFASGVVPRSLENGFVERIRFNRLRSGKIQVVLDLERPLDYKVFTLQKPDRIVVDVTHKGRPAAPVSDPTPPPVTPPRRGVPPGNPPSRSGWIVAVDAGHGGEDTGARAFGVTEKTITLALARDLVEELNQRPGIRAFLVRKGDYFIPLRRRWTLAEKQGADLFLSLHCNASRSKRAEGSEVYFVSLKGASDEAAHELAEFENSVDEKMGVDIPEDDLNGIIFDMMQTDVMAKSQMLAETCLDHLFELGTVYSRGVKQAGFAVLKSPRMPSVLVEAAFISNREENKMLRDRKWQRLFGRRLADGVEAYIRSVDGTERVELR